LCPARPRRRGGQQLYLSLGLFHGFSFFLSAQLIEAEPDAEDQADDGTNAADYDADDGAVAEAAALRGRVIGCRGGFGDRVARWPGCDGRGMSDIGDCVNSASARLVTKPLT
jgi:hypothetical protein